MAKGRARAAQIVRVPTPVFQRQPAQVIQIRAPRARAPAKPKKHHRRRSAGGGALTPKTMLGATIGGAIFGFIEKTFPQLPTIPMLGRAGTVALVGYAVTRKVQSGIVRDVTLAAAVLAGYELGKDGKISGDVSPQVHGISSQV